MPYESRALANYLLDLADEMRLQLTHMALHKIVYYAHGWRLAEAGSPLISEQFEAWEYGPVLPTVYAAFKGAGKAPVTVRAKRFDPATQAKYVAHCVVEPADVEFLRNMLKAYGHLHALTLSDMTHRPGGAWDGVWNASGGRITLGMKIKNDSIRRDFLATAPRLPRTKSDLP